MISLKIFKIECQTEIAQKYLLHRHRFAYPLILILNKTQHYSTIQNYLFKTEFNSATLFKVFQSEVKRWLMHCVCRIKPVDE